MAKVFADDAVLDFTTSGIYLTQISSTVYDQAGNNNGILEPGETADFTTTMTNFGSATAFNTNGILDCSSSYITINDASGNYGDIAQDDTVENTVDRYNVTASASTPYGSEIDVSVYVDAGSYVDTFDFTLVVGKLVPSDTGYYYTYYSGGPHVQSPVYEWIAIDSTQSTYPGTSLNLTDDNTVQVSLPFTFRYYGIDYTQISICSNGWIAMGTETTTDYTNSAIPNVDGPEAMVAGLWDDLDPGNTGEASDVYYYFDAPTHRFIIQYFRIMHYPTGSPEDFEIILYDPVYYPTPTGDGEIIVQYLIQMQQTDNTLGIENFSETVGVQYYLDGTYDPLGVTITDEFAIKYTTYPPDQVPGVEEIGSIIPTKCELMIHPSIARLSVKMTYNIYKSQQNAGIKIYDAVGRLVKQFDNLSDSQSTVTWNMEDELGKKVSNGVYFVNLETENNRVTRKLVVLK